MDVHTSANVWDDDSVTAAGGAGEGGIGLVDLGGHCDVYWYEERWSVKENGSIDIESAVAEQGEIEGTIGEWEEWTER
jgi:hypothetical protein